LEGLRSASSYVKGELSRRMKLRRTPEVVFHLDKGLEKGTAVLGVLHRLENERQSRLQAEADAAGTELKQELDSHLLETPQNPNGSPTPEADGP
jgi:ribosome-binding factor A